MTDLASFHPPKKFFWGALIGSVTFAVPLIGFTVNGSFMRYSGDDYCYANLLAHYGFIKAQWIAYLNAQPFNGNRYSLTLFSSLSDSLGPHMNGILPGLVIAIWILSIIYTLQQAAKPTGIPLQISEKIFLAEIMVFFTLYLAPDLPQVLYWRSGMLPYLAPLIANSFLIGLIIKYIQRIKSNLPAMIPVVLLAFLAGGFSETSGTLQAGYFLVLLLGGVLLLRKKVKWAPKAIEIIGVSLLSTLLALLTLAVSPSNTDRLLKSSRPDLFSFLRISISSAASFMVDSLKGQPIPVVILFLIAMAITWLIASRSGRSLRLRRSQWVLLMISIPIISSVLIIFCTAPSAYAQSAYPELRALITARWVMVLSILASGSLISLLVYHSFYAIPRKYPLINRGVWVLLCLLCLYPLYASKNIYRDIPMYQRWATFWDPRHQEILTAVQAGQTEVEVIKIDHVIPGVGDLSEDPAYWYNVCAAGYYGIKSISANQEGWDDTLP